MCIIVSAVIISFFLRLSCEVLNLYFSLLSFLVWYVICIFSPCESYFLWLENIFFLQCEQIILCSLYCASKLVRPVYALNNKSLSSEIKMLVRTKAETHEELLQRFPPCLLLSPSFCSCQEVGTLLGTLLSCSSTLILIIIVGLKVNLELLEILVMIYKILIFEIVCHFQWPLFKKHKNHFESL